MLGRAILRKRHPHAVAGVLGRSAAVELCAKAGLRDVTDDVVI